MRPPRFFGWRVVGAAFVTAVFAWGIGFYGPPIFLQVLQARHDWPVPLLSAAVTLQFLLGALVVGNLARLHRRFGQCRCLRAGGLLTALGLVGWGCADQPWQLFLAVPFSAVGWALTSAAALNAMVAPWFIRQRPAALGMAFNGASLGGLIFSPLWVALIGGFGFPAAAALVAALVAVTLWYLAGRYLAVTPGSLGLLPDGASAAVQAPVPVLSSPARPLANAICRDARFASLTLASSLALFAQIGLVAHLFSLLVPVLGQGGAGLAMGGATGCAILGRSLAAGLLRPGTGRRQVAAANLAVQATGSLVLLLGGGSVPLTLLGCGLFGVGIGNVTSLPPLIAQQDFRSEDLPRVVALVTAIGQASYAFAPAVFSLLRGQETLFFLAAAALQLAAAALFLRRCA